MTISDEAPQIFQKLEELFFLSKANSDAAGDMDGAEFALSLESNSKFWEQLKAIDKIVIDIQGLIAEHTLSAASKKRFTDAVNEHLDGPFPTHVTIMGPDRGSLFNFETPGEWFSLSVFHPDSVLDRGVYISVIHPELIDEANKKWNHDRRVYFAERPPSGSYEDERRALLGKYGITGDTSDWYWAHEALSVVERVKQVFDLKFRLSDFVAWTCTDEPGNVRIDAQFGEPEFFQAAGFGQRPELPDFERIGSLKVWKVQEKTYLSPLWVYLGWRAGSYAEGNEYARNLADIGEGLDAAVLSLDSAADPDDEHRIRLTPTYIFRAGEAVTKLRVKLQIEDATIKGMKAEAAEKLRAERGGRASASSRAARRAALLDGIESLVRDNPRFARMDPRFAAAQALEDCIASDPALWSQGRGQIDEYIGEIRRGEAGGELQSRFLSLFTTRTA